MDPGATDIRRDIAYKKGIIISINPNPPLPISWEVPTTFIARLCSRAGLLVLSACAAEAELLAQAVLLALPRAPCPCTAAPSWAAGPARGSALGTSTQNRHKQLMLVPPVRGELHWNLKGFPCVLGREWDAAAGEVCEYISMWVLQWRKNAPETCLKDMVAEKEGLWVTVQWWR